MDLQLTNPLVSTLKNWAGLTSFYHFYVLENNTLVTAGLCGIL